MNLLICPWDPEMTTAAISGAERTADLVRRLALAGLMAALVFAVSADRFEWRKECRGDFGPGFSRDFDVRRCNVVVRSLGGDLELHLPLPK
jgi:hypothetical protein